MEGWLTVFVGTYTKLGAEGLYACRFDPSSGAIERVGLAPGIQDPTFLALDPSGEHLYAVSEIEDGDGTVTAYVIGADGSLTRQNVVSTGGPGACHLSIDRTDSYVVVANYHGGSVGVLPVQEDGSLGPRSDFVQHEGSSINANRQEAAHAHCAMIDGSNDRVYVCDLGMDTIIVYGVDHQAGRLVALPDLAVQSEAGDGPRHLDFHPSQRFAYALNELGSTVAVYDYDVRSGALTATQRISTLPLDWRGSNFSADIHVAADGRFVYASNRGHDSIAIFAVDSLTGRLESRGHASTHGEVPRNFAFAPDGRFLLVANQESNNIVVFNVDAASGQLEFSGHEVEVPAPVCLKIWSRG